MVELIDWRTCTNCPLSENTTPVRGYGTRIEPEVVFIGEAPGAKEEKMGVPFVGPSGMFLRDIIQVGGFEDQNIYITNVVKCRPPDNRTPNTKEIKACEAHLSHELEMLEPPAVVFLGKAAASLYIKGSFKMGQIAGKIQSPAAKKVADYQPEIVMITYHPRYVMQGSFDAREYEMHFVKLRGELDE